MLMEAMRLSLLDHEEHQRKEAEEKKKQEAAAAAGASAPSENISESQASGPEPSTSEPLASLQVSNDQLSSTSSLQRLPNPSPSKDNNGNSKESLDKGRRSWSISRSRTPPPPNPVSNIPQSEENQAAWRNRTTGPPAFSTLSAALTSTSTATAFLGTSRSATPEPTLNQGPSASSSAAVPLPDMVHPIPTITVQVNNDTRSGRLTPVAGASRVSAGDAGVSALSSDPEVASNSCQSAGASGSASIDIARAASPRSSITSLESDSESGVGIGLAAYGHLASSPESTLSHEPLLYSSNSVTNIDDSPTKDRAVTATNLEEISR